MIIDIALDAPAQLFAAVDGAQFENISTLFEKINVRAMSLFPEAQQGSAESGPWLVNVDTRATLTRFLDALAGDHAFVLWSFPAGETDAYAHLQRLNHISLVGSQHMAEETLLFRHCDPSALHEVLGILDADQRSTLFGGARQIVVPPNIYVDRPVVYSNLNPSSRVAALSIRHDQISYLDKQRSDDEAMRSIKYLEHVDSGGLAHLSRPQQMALVKSYRESARAFGLTSEPAQLKWLYLMSVSDGAVSKDPAVRRHMSFSEGPADRKIDYIMAEFEKVWQAGRR